MEGSKSHSRKFESESLVMLHFICFFFFVGNWKGLVKELVEMSYGDGGFFIKYALIDQFSTFKAFKFSET